MTQSGGHTAGARAYYAKDRSVGEQALAFRGEQAEAMGSMQRSFSACAGNS